MERYMAKRTLKNIPDEIKNVVELFYLRGPDIACAEAARLRQTHPELNGILDDVLILFNHAPESVFMFYEALTQLPPELPDDLSFSVGNLMDDVSSSDQMALDFPEESATPDADLTFEALLNQSMNATAVPSVFADGSNGQRRDGKSYGNSGRSLSSRPPLRPNTDISLNIDIVEIAPSRVAVSPFAPAGRSVLCDLGGKLDAPPHQEDGKTREYRRPHADSRPHRWPVCASGCHGTGGQHAPHGAQPAPHLHEIWALPGH